MYIHVQKVRGNPTIIQRIKNHKRNKKCNLNFIVYHKNNMKDFLTRLLKE